MDSPLPMEQMTEKERHVRKLLAEIETLKAQLGKNKAKEKDYKSLLNTSRDILYRSDLSGYITYITPSVEHISGFSVEEVVGCSLAEDLYLYPEHRKEMLAILDRDGHVEDFTTQFKQKDGGFWWGAVTSHWIKDETGSVVGVEGIVRDVTNDVEKSSALQESERRYKALSDASFGGIAIHDQGIILDCNKGLATQTGYAIDELIGMDGFNLIAPEYLGTVIENVKRGYEHPYEVMCVRKDGTRYPASIRGSVIPYRDKNVRVTEFRDITQTKQAEEEKHKLEEQLFQAQKMELVGQLAGGIAHDFNNMLTVIIGHTDLAIHKAGEKAPLLKDLVKIKKAAEHSSKITHQLLAFARKQTVEPKTVDLNEIVEGMLHMLRRLIGEDISLVWRPSEELWLVKMDISQINQILVNLCVNARDAIDGGGQLTVSTDNYYAGSPSSTDDRNGDAFVRLTVKDNGRGMDQSTLDHIFEPFFTTKDVGHGTGLGLATVYGIIKQNGGRIHVDSTPGQGSIFEIFLPRHKGLGDEMDQSAETLQVRGGSEKIIMVEDEASILEMGKEMLEQLGYDVIATSSPYEAIEIIRRGTMAHLLLTDVIMPEMNGKELIDTLRKINPSINYIYMSGYTADIVSNQGILENDINLIQKPFSFEELAVKIRKALDK